MTGLCKYANMFGEPGKGSHAVRVGGLAAVDLLLTAGLAAVITRFGLKRTDMVAFALVFILLIAVAVCTHEAFCVRTQLNAWIFGRPWPSAAGE
jgi:hypothetical protein